MRITSGDVNNPAQSALAQWAGISYVPEDAAVRGYIDAVKGAYAKATAPKPAAPKAEPVVEAAEVAVEAVVPAAPAVDEDVMVKSNDGQKNFYLYVVHTNDVHGRIEADPGVGYANLATLVNMGRSVTNKNLLLDAGDVSHGTLLTNLFEGETAAVLLDMLGYDAVVPGNHDFNYGKERLIEAARLLNSTRI